MVFTIEEWLSSLRSLTESLIVLFLTMAVSYFAISLLNPNFLLNRLIRFEWLIFTEDQTEIAAR